MSGKKEYQLLLEFGHKSEPLKKPQPVTGYTHKWTVYLKGVNDARLEHCISRVVFQLHESFDNPFREITQPPYRVKETGYAGFAFPIRVYFRNKEKPNDITYVHNLELNPTSEHKMSHIEKVMFINPNKEFEKCLIRTGALEQPSKSKDRKDRSESPSSKKSKSASALIPSKDIGKPNLPIQSNGRKSNQTSNHSSSHSNHTTSSQHQINKSSSHHQINKSSHHVSKSSSQQQMSKSSQHSHQSQKTSLPKVKSESKDFVDLFGAPLVYSKKQTSSKLERQHEREWSKSPSSKKKKSTPALIPSKDIGKPNLPSQINGPRTNQTISNHSTSHSSQSTLSQPQIQKSSQQNNHQSLKTPVPKIKPESKDIADLLGTSPVYNKKQDVSNNNTLHAMQAKIVGLNDPDRLQRIVDIIEGSGEWFNLTSKKFEFDLKRLDKKTLHEIEKCLQENIST